MLGSTAGVMLAQQTAANLHASIGDRFHDPALRPAAGRAEVAGIVDLPNADAMFQGIGLSKGAAPQAPPDNVALMPLPDWHRLFDPQAAARPDTVRLQMHTLIDRSRLRASPEAAYADALAAGHNLEAQMAGQGLLANNLAARLDAVRSDALYAKVLFLFLGAPGIAVAILLTLTVTGAGRATTASGPGLAAGSGRYHRADPRSRVWRGFGRGLGRCSHRGSPRLARGRHPARREGRS